MQSTIEILYNNPNAPEREEGEAAVLGQPKQHLGHPLIHSKLQYQKNKKKRMRSRRGRKGHKKLLKLKIIEYSKF